ncbi:MAG: DUF1684 domain-containing protein [Chloroflexi bacterium]|nr:MAG: DUF1684 domain-containing protein [Chloroflexota bacterium]MBL1193661.1 DUF1684 domain-containing protein [Chloroflexota bacterium]NOH10953.1 DUF1684 domain-containing protein [Chloroflexota bacterium]
MTELEQFRHSKDELFATDPNGPLTPEQRASFESLNYFEENPDLRLEIEVQPFEEQKDIQMQTSTGDMQTYKRYGRFKFEVDGEEAELTLYASQHGFFLPYVDSQAGEATYGAGRYLDPTVLPNGKFLIDFNMGYNPYCAYNEMWSCPLPPAENRVKVAIKAGEKNFN